MYLGIDLGTSNSAVAGVSGGRVRLFKTPEGTDTMPSVIHRDRRGNQTVGVRAYDQAALAPDNAVDGFKRLMGTDTLLTFASTGESITPERAAAEILRVLVGQAMLESGADAVSGTVVTIPAAFNHLQSEATLAAARSAGLQQVALLQEPVAAALASMAVAHDRSGIFMVYDLGGGTFDTTLVHAQEGEVTVLAHEGVAMLGGRDLDRAIVNQLVTAWLRRTFRLPDAFAIDPRYARLLRVARRASEVAKIALSTREQSSVNASDEDVRLEDLDGEPIYLNVPLRRQDLEGLAGESIDRSVACCREMLGRAGFRHEDVARVVLIGGPTKMPLLRRRVQECLGIRVEELGHVDPMTAVAEGAAIYCEGRSWSATGSAAKPTRRVEDAGTTVVVAYDIEARTPAAQALLQVRQTSGPSGAEVLVESLAGWSSGRRPLDQPVSLELPLHEPGVNRFRATVFDAAGIPVRDAGREIAVERLLAATGGVPATQTIAAKLIGDDDRNVLEVLVQKGTLLPASGVAHYRLSEPMRAGAAGAMRVELFQVGDERVLDPALNLAIGEFRVRADDLPEGAALRRGDEVVVHWAMSEGQEIVAEVELPSVGQWFDRRNFYDWQLGRQSFTGEDGDKLATALLEEADRDLTRAEEAVPAVAAAPLAQYRKQLDQQIAAARGAPDPDARKKVSEETRLIRQQVAAICLLPEARRHLLRHRLEAQRRFYDRDVRGGATRDQAAQVDTLLHAARVALDGGDKRALELASQQIFEVGRLYWAHGLNQEAFCAMHFRLVQGRRHLARDVASFDRSIVDGERALAASDRALFRSAVINLIMGEVPVSAGTRVGERASLMRA